MLPIWWNSWNHEETDSTVCCGAMMLCSWDLGKSSQFSSRLFLFSFFPDGNVTDNIFIGRLMSKMMVEDLNQFFSGTWNPRMGQPHLVGDRWWTRWVMNGFGNRTERHPVQMKCVLITAGQIQLGFSYPVYKSNCPFTFRTLLWCKWIAGSSIA